ncbi:LamG domain-containing protein [Patescibacteria group bacterium]|nr:LamG domain-containing protein [Patescibacteria group bacterium]
MDNPHPKNNFFLHTLAHYADRTFCFAVKFNESGEYGEKNCFSDEDYPINQWHYISAVYTNNYLYLYMNGVLIQSADKAGKTLSTNDRFLGIGKMDEGFYPFDGFISDVKIYNRALSTEEVQLLYDKGR